MGSKVFKTIVTAIALYLICSSMTYAQDITPDGMTDTTVLHIGPNITNVSTKTIKGSNAFNSFSKFNVSQGNTVNLEVPTQSERLINVIHQEKTNVDGILNSYKDGKIGGEVYFINPHGMTIGKSGVLNVGSLTAITPDKSVTDNFFDSPGNPNQQVVENVLQGNYKINPEAEFVNEGVINAKNNVSIDAGSVLNTGRIQANSTDDVIFSSIVNYDLPYQSLEMKKEGGKIVIKAQDTIKNAGEVTAVETYSKKAGDIVLESQGSILLDRESYISVDAGKTLSYNPEDILTPGDITLTAEHVSVGGEISSSGTRGGKIVIDAGNLSLAGNIEATGTLADGGSVAIDVANSTLETSSSTINVSGASGGEITHLAEKQITTSGNYIATGTAGKGGDIKMSASVVKVLSSEIDASGTKGGGEILLGGEYQGGKNLETDVIPNAKTVVVNSGAEIKADSTGYDGDGGKIITWADDKAVVLADYSAKPGQFMGDGGFVEISSGDALTFNAFVETGIGNRKGTVLLDPKNINIVDDRYNEYSLVMGYNYKEQAPSAAPEGYTVDLITDSEKFGSDVSLDGNRLVVGAEGGDGLRDGSNGGGRVYLFTFEDDHFGGLTLEGVIGKDAVGGKNIDTSGYNTDLLGFSVSLDGTKLAVGDVFDSGKLGDRDRAGAVHLFSFDDLAFSNGQKQATIGYGYDGVKDYNLSSLDEIDHLGTGVSLDGNRLAIGSDYDDGLVAGSTNDNYGAVYLFSFDDDQFTNLVLEAKIGKGYSGGNNVDLAQLDTGDTFGYSVSLSGNSLAVGAPSDDGSSNSLGGAGAVYLFRFDDDQFTNLSHQGTIGIDYSGAKSLSIDRELRNADTVGESVSLDGTMLAIGARGEDGYSDQSRNTGAVVLISFADVAFSTPTFEALIGKGHSFGKDIPIKLDREDNFGSSVSLDNNRLAVSAIKADAETKGLADSGEVYLFTFDDDKFAGGELKTIIGADAGLTRSVNVKALEDNDNFGASLSLNNNRLAVGARKDDGFNNTSIDTGAVYLYSFENDQFNNATLEGIIGKGYTGGKNVNETNLDDFDYFGSGVSLYNNTLAVGAAKDDGVANGNNNAGAVYLYRFDDLEFTNGTRETILGKGHNFDVSSLNDLDAFGSSVALFDSGLVVGATDNDGASNIDWDTGAVYLFSFDDDHFSGLTQEGIIGHGYNSGSKDIDISSTLGDSDVFGVSVSYDNNRLAVGARRDDDFTNTSSDTGAVYLFTFDDNVFSNGQHRATIGKGYSDFNIATLDDQDYFGGGVALQGNKLAITAYQDQGINNNGVIDGGAVYLFNVNDDFSTIDHVGTIGQYYTGKSSYSLTLDTEEQLGKALAMDGNMLAVGTRDDNGNFNNFTDTGAVYLFNFDNDQFENINLVGIMGKGYHEVPAYKGVNVELEDDDYFGSAVSLDGTMLAIGAEEGDSNDGADRFLGKVYLYTFDDDTYSNLTLHGIIGSGFSGGKNIDLSAVIDTDAALGASVSLDSNRLAVGAPEENGLSGINDAGAVYLFTFTDSTFSGGTHVGTIGAGYGGAKDYNLTTLSDNDSFGSAVALEGTSLLVGANKDDGSGNVSTDSGAVYIFGFDDTAFTNPQHLGTIGKGYNTLAEDIDFAQLDVGDEFGSSVSLDGTSLAAGAKYDDGAGVGSTGDDYGAVHLLTFAAGHVGTIGKGYNTLSKDYNFADLDTDDNFGRAVSLDGNMLAVGATGNDGDLNRYRDTGAVHLFTFDDTSFSNAQYNLSIGAGQLGADDINLDIGLGSDSYFGSAVSLDGKKLAVGARDYSGHLGVEKGSGGAFLFTFNDTSLQEGSLKVAIGENFKTYTEANKNTFITAGKGDEFGSSTSLDGRRLVVGAYSADGFGDTTEDSGEVYLFTFDDDIFSNAKLEGIMGKGYTGGKNVDVSSLEAQDYFGTAVSLDGNMLAIGASGDDGSGNAAENTGGVYLYRFEDEEFTNGVHQGTIGYGYVGAKDVDTSSSLVSFNSGDWFGRSVSLDNKRLAVGAYDDATDAQKGVVSLFTFDDDVFTNGQMVSAIGDGKVVHIGLDSYDNFGSSVSLDGNRIAVGASGDDGISNSGSNRGAVGLFTFSDDQFTGGTLRSTLGYGYIGANDYDLTSQLDTLGDDFGSSVSLDGSRLAVGASGADGSGNSKTDSGEVYLFTFADSHFSTPALKSILGAGYNTGNNVDVTSLEKEDSFGQSVSLDGKRLVVGASLNDGLQGDLRNAGKVYLYSFDDSNFSNGSLVGGISAATLSSGSYLTTDSINHTLSHRISAVSLDGTRMAVSDLGDSGFDDSFDNAGAVYLYTFSDEYFTDMTLQSIVGKGYTGGKNIDVSSLAADDWFGVSVALERNQLAVSATGDDGALNNQSGAGAVYLFGFEDETFGGGAQKGIIGYGYTGLNDYDVTSLGYDADDYLGDSVSIDNNRIAIGSLDKGDQDWRGSVILFSYDDDDFSNLTYQAMIAYGAFGGKNYNESIDQWDMFGSSVSLDGNRLAVGAKSADGNSNSYLDSGEVYLYTFDDPLFTNIQRVLKIGRGFSGAGLLGVSNVGSDDNFGRTVSLEGNRLVVGAPFDDGFGNSNTDAGAVYLLEFGNEQFNSPSLLGIIGSGYAGSSDRNIVLENYDYFGDDVSLNNGNLAVFVAGDDGFRNEFAYKAIRLYKDVYLSQITPVSLVGNSLLFGDSSGSTSNILASSIESFLNGSQNVILQASNDINVNASITSTGAGNLTLQAGRSLFVNESINTNTGNITLIGNDLLANGVVDSDRDSGDAVIAMDSSATLTGNTVTLDLRNGAGKTYATAGAITLSSINASTVFVTNALGSVVDGTIGDIAANIASTGEIHLSAASGSIGTAVEDIDISATGVISALASGDINLNAISGDFNLAEEDINSTAGDVYITVDAGDIIDTAGETNNWIFGNDISLIATNGTIGLDGGNIDFNASGNVTSSANGYISLQDHLGDFSLNTITSVSGDIRLDNNSGNIVDASLGESANISTPGRIRLTVGAGGIGTVLEDVETETSNVLNISASGEVNITELSNDLKLGLINAPGQSVKLETKDLGNATM